MAIFTSGNTMYSDIYNTYSVSPTEEGSEEILYEASRDMYKLVGALYVSDIMIESAVLEGAGDAEVLTEGTFKDFIDKIVKKFKELWEKIKAWFGKVVESVKIFFMSGEKFAKTYETKILERAKKLTAKTQVYFGYDYKIKAADLKGEIMSRVDTFKDAIDAKCKAMAAKDEKTTSQDIIEDAYKKLGKGDNAAEVKEKFAEEVRGGTSLPTGTVSFNVKDLIDTCKNQKTLISHINELEAKTKRNIDAIIADLQKADKDGENAAQVSVKSTAYNAVVTLQQGLNSTGVTLVKEMYRSYTQTLKKIMTVKLESYTEGEDNDGTSLFESAMNLL